VVGFFFFFLNCIYVQINSTIIFLRFSYVPFSYSSLIIFFIHFSCLHLCACDSQMLPTPLAAHQHKISHLFYQLTNLTMHISVLHSQLTCTFLFFTPNSHAHFCSSLLTHIVIGMKRATVDDEALGHPLPLSSSNLTVIVRGVNAVTVSG
jgi:hypothetical protein